MIGSQQEYNEGEGTMAGSTVLERTTEKSGTQTAQTEVSAAEQQHNERKADFLKLLYADEEPETTVATVAQVASVSAPASSGAAQRLADYKSYTMPASKHILFGDVAYKDGELISESAVKTEPVAAPVAAPVSAAAAELVSAPVIAPTEEDALPTRRTMDTLRQSTVAAETAQSTRLFAGISTRAKVVLAAIVAAIVLAITVICINTGIINSLDANIANLRQQVAEETIKYEGLEKELEDINNFEGPIKELVEEFAKSHGMVRG